MVKKVKNKEPKKVTIKSAYKSVRGSFSAKPLYKRGSKELKRETGRRQKQVLRVMKAIGVGSGGKREGAGRPYGSFKYGMPIQKWKLLQAKNRAMYEQYQAEQQQKLQAKGFTPEQIQQLEYQRQIESAQSQQQGISQVSQTQESQQQFNQQGIAQQRQLPYSQRVMNAQQQLQANQQQRYLQAQQMMQRPLRKSSQTQFSQQQIQQFDKTIGVADEELKFRGWLAKNTISPHTQDMLVKLRRIQNLPDTKNIEAERRRVERKMLSNQMSILNAPFVLNKYSADFTGVNPETNILMAQNIFKSRPDNKIMKTNRPNILQTRESGNSLNLFGSRF
jgi:hypothetical protein